REDHAAIGVPHEHDRFAHCLDRLSHILGVCLEITERGGVLSRARELFNDVDTVSFLFQQPGDITPIAAADEGPVDKHIVAHRSHLWAGSPYRRTAKYGPGGTPRLRPLGRELMCDGLPNPFARTVETSGTCVPPPGTPA